MTPGDAPKLRKVIIQLSMDLRTGMDYFYSLPVTDLLDTIREVAEIGDDRRKRIQARNQNRGNHR